MTDKECKTECRPDYEAECTRIKEELCKMNARNEGLRRQVEEMNLTIAELSGKIEAYEFAITKGGINNG